METKPHTEFQDLIFIITSIKIGLWGTKVEVRGLDNPDMPNEYLVMFRDCSKISWESIDPDVEEIEGIEASVIGFTVTQNADFKQAILNCGFFELSVSYRNHEVFKLSQDNGMTQIG